MVRLPGEESFSSIPSARSGRVIAREDTSARYEGAKVFGRGLQDAGGAAMDFAEAQARRAALQGPGGGTDTPMPTAGAGEQGPAAELKAAAPEPKEQGAAGDAAAKDAPRQGLHRQLAEIAAIDDPAARHEAFDAVTAKGRETISNRPDWASEAERDDALTAFDIDADRTFGRLLAKRGRLTRDWTVGAPIAAEEPIDPAAPERRAPLLRTLPPNEARKLGHESDVRGTILRQTRENTAFKEAIRAIGAGTFAEDEIGALVASKAITRPEFIAGLNTALGDHQAELATRDEATAHFGDDAFAWNEADPQHRKWADGVWHAVPDAAESFLAPGASEADRENGEKLALAIVERIGFVPPALAAVVKDALGSKDSDQAQQAELFMDKFAELNTADSGLRYHGYTGPADGYFTGLVQWPQRTTPTAPASAEPQAYLGPDQITPMSGLNPSAGVGGQLILAEGSIGPTAEQVREFQGRVLSQVFAGTPVRVAFDQALEVIPGGLPALTASPEYIRTNGEFTQRLSVALLAQNAPIVSNRDWWDANYERFGLPRNPDSVAQIDLARQTFDPVGFAAFEQSPAGGALRAAQRLVAPPGDRDGPLERSFEVGLQGMGRGLADVVGGPIDLATSGLNLGIGALNLIPGVAIPPISNPFMGSDWIANNFTPIAEGVGLTVRDPLIMTPQEQASYTTNRIGAQFLPMHPYGLGILDPPPKPRRLFNEDYPSRTMIDAAGDPAPIADDVGRLLVDIDGRPLVAEYVVGRQMLDGLDQPLQSTEQLEDLVYRLTGQRVYYYLPQGDLHGVAGFTSPDRSGLPTLVGIDQTMSPDDIRRVLEHEVGHVIDQIAWEVPTDGLEIELRQLYSQLNFPRRPQDFGYTGDEIPREYMAEAFRAYMSDPNYIKTVAPDVAARIRTFVNGHPTLSSRIQFNTLVAPVAAPFAVQDLEPQPDAWTEMPPEGTVGVLPGGAFVVMRNGRWANLT